MHFEVKADVRKFPEQAEQRLGMPVVVVEGTVEHADVPYAMLMDRCYPFPDLLDWEGAHRFFPSTDTECTSIEASPRCLKLHERLSPVEERTRLRRSQPVECNDSGQSVVLINTLFPFQVTESGNSFPHLFPVPVFQPEREHFFSFSTEYTVHKAVAPQKLLIVSQKLRSPQDDAAVGQQGLGPRKHMKQDFMIEEPAGSRNDIGLFTEDFAGSHAAVFIDGSRNDVPFIGAFVDLRM